jgi:hypothetical protein
MRKATFFWMMVLGFWVVVTAASPSLAAYSSHQNDQDINNFLAVYPFARSTKLDDCSLCHPGGKITQGTKTTSYGSCDYCHIKCNLQTSCTDVPLNGYGQAYKNADTGRRSEKALRDIAGVDSDGDNYANSEEINALTFPGDASDHPGLTPASAVVLNQERILKLPDHSEFLFLNASKSSDWYARYRGVKIQDLLKYVGISRQATQITVFAPDGFSKTFLIDALDPQSPNINGYQYDVMGPYPFGHYYGGLDFVEYSFAPLNLINGNQIPDKLYMLLAYLRDGDPLTKGKLVRDPQNAGRLVLDGEGPYRLIPPQKLAGGPDRPSANPDPTDPTWNYDSTKDHNAGSSVRSVTAIRVEPLPAGTTDFKWIEGGWNLVDQAKLVIYGAIDPRTYPVEGRVLDSKGKPIADVKLTFGLLSLGKVGEATTSSAEKQSKKMFESGKFQIDLPAGEYTVVPSKEGCTFTPASLSISLPDAECDLDRDHSGHWDRHPEYEINITASCVP